MVFASLLWASDTPARTAVWKSSRTVSMAMLRRKKSAQTDRQHGGCLVVAPCVADVTGKGTVDVVYEFPEAVGIAA